MASASAFPAFGVKRSGAPGPTVRRCLLPLAAILLVTTWPWAEFQNHAHWDAVEWVPFTKYVRPLEWLANVALFVPFGAAFAWGGSSHRRVRRAAAIGLACSLAAELAQVFMHGRAPTVADVLANTLGTYLGARWAVARAHASPGHHEGT